MHSRFTGKKLFLLLPIIVIVLFGFGHLPAAQSLNGIPFVVQRAYSAADADAMPQEADSPKSAVSTQAESCSSSTPVRSATPASVLKTISSLQSTATLSPGGSNAPLPLLEEFVRQVTNGQAGSVRGLYVQHIMALRVVQQPKGKPSYIHREDGTATQFQNANLFGAIGLLAHNFLSGRNFFRLELGQDLILVYGDGSLQHYQVSEIADYQRLTLADLRSNFLELASSQLLTADQVFAKYYQRAHTLILQTCLEQNGISDWGVRFIVGEPAQ